MRFTKSKKWWRRRYKEERKFFSGLDLSANDWATFFKSKPVVANRVLYILFGPHPHTVILRDTFTHWDKLTSKEPITSWEVYDEMEDWTGEKAQFIAQRKQRYHA